MALATAAALTAAFSISLVAGYSSALLASAAALTANGVILAAATRVAGTRITATWDSAGVLPLVRLWIV